MKRLSTIVAVLVVSLGLPILVLGRAQSGLTSEIAPLGKIRIATIGIEVVGGVAQPVGEFIANRLGLPFEPIVYVTPEAWAESFGKGEWDLAIGPRAVAPEGKADVISDLWLVDLIYLAAPGQEFADTTQTDRPARAKLIYLEQILALSMRLPRSCLGKNSSRCVQYYSANDAAAKRPIRRGSGETRATRGRGKANWHSAGGYRKTGTEGCSEVGRETARDRSAIPAR
jgi:hypothetical protein